MLFRTFNQKLLYDTNDTLLINQRCENVNLLGALSGVGAFQSFEATHCSK